MSRGKFITFEGGEGVGKTTNVSFVESYLQARNIPLVVTREPGGTPLAEKLRTLLLNKKSEAIAEEAELLLMFAARAQHIKHVIEPALARGDWVVCDRFTDATYAYQGGGRGLDKRKFAQLEQWVHGHLQPDLTFLFDLAPAVAGERIAAQGRELDRFEQEQADFHDRVRQAYLERAASAPDRIRVINAAQTLVEIKKRVEETVSTYCL